MKKARRVRRAWLGRGVAGLGASALDGLRGKRVEGNALHLGRGLGESALGATRSTLDGLRGKRVGVNARHLGGD